MTAFRFRFESVLRYRKSRRDLCLQYLAQVLADDRALAAARRDQLHARREEQLEELRKFGRTGRISVDGATARRYYIGQLAGEIRVVEHQRIVVAGQIDLCRKALAQAEKEVRILEKLKDKQAAAATRDQIREERALEEVWQAVRLREGDKMIRSAIVIFCVFCVATVLSEIAGIGLLWFRGQLTSATVAEIRLALAGSEAEAPIKDDEVDRAQPSSEDVTRQRSLAILSLSARDDQIQLLNDMIEKNRKSLLEAEKGFEEKRAAFEQQLAEVEKNLTSQSTEQARAILLAMPPLDAVNHLMELDLKQCVELVKGMPEKKAATILQEFFVANGPKNDERIKRGHEILIAIGAGEPQRKLIEAAARAQSAGETPGTARN